MRLFFLGSVWLLSGLLAGCATYRSVGDVRTDLRQVDLRLERLGQQLGSVDSLLLVQQAESRRQRAELAGDSEQLRLRMQQLQARMDEMVRRLAEMRQEVELLRVYGVGKGPPARPSSPAAAPADTAASPEPAMVADPQQLYDMALSDMKAGNYQLAAVEFAQFLESFPGDELADNALYWQGECYYARKDYARAAASFEQLLKDYPAGDKVPAALLKLGYALLETKEQKRGTQRLNELVKKFPDSEEAAQAKARLKAPAKGKKKR
jgi:tol-pal system protein YbgF